MFETDAKFLSGHHESCHARTPPQRSRPDAQLHRRLRGSSPRTVLARKPDSGTSLRSQKPEQAHSGAAIASRARSDAAVFRKRSGQIFGRADPLCSSTTAVPSNEPTAAADCQVINRSPTSKKTRKLFMLMHLA